MPFGRILEPVSRQGRDDLGRYEESVPLNDVRQFFRRSEPHTAAEIADELGVSSRTALNKLEQLHEAGEIKRKKVGARAVVWYRELNPQLASEVLAEATGQPMEVFEFDREDHPIPELDDLRRESVSDG